MTKYQTKGAKHSENSKKMLKEIMDAYCNDARNVDKTVRSVMGKHMNETTKGMSVPKDQAVFCLAGGLLKRSKIGSTMKCSVNTIPIEDLHVAVGPDEVEPTSQAFNWGTIQKKYKTRTALLEGTNLYS